MKKLKYLLLLIFINFVFLSKNVFAQLLNPDLIKEVEKQGKAVQKGSGFQDGTVGGTVGTIITALLSLLGVLFVALLIHSGFLWMTAGGNSEQVEKAKTGIFRSIIGLLIIVSAYSIMYFVFKYMLN